MYTNKKKQFWKEQLQYNYNLLEVYYKELPNESKKIRNVRKIQGIICKLVNYKSKGITIGNRLKQIRIMDLWRSEVIT